VTESLTLYELLERSGAQVRAYDIGRRIGPLEREAFLAFEQATAPYPRPMQRKAWIALVQDSAATGDEPVIWFLRLGLDEQGLLIQAERDYLLHRLLESVQARHRGGDPQTFLQDNPCAFTPREDRMALFHAVLSADLGLPPSRFYAHALDYFRGKPGWDQWGFVGYQGIADLACRHDDAPLTGAIGHLPREPLVALCHCLESRLPSPALIDALIDRLHNTLANAPDDGPLLAAIVRGLSARADSPQGQDIEVLAAIAGRAWDGLADADLLQAYLLRLADSDHGQPVFEHCITDLLALPGVAPGLRRALRSPSQSPSIRRAFARMTGGNAAPGRE
jgi:hypothetical protein